MIASRQFTHAEVTEAVSRLLMTGEDQWVGGAPDLDRMRALGRQDGYPECCIEAFVADIAADRSPAQLRGVGRDGCVPCPVCVGPLAASALRQRRRP